MLLKMKIYQAPFIKTYSEENEQKRILTFQYHSGLHFIIVADEMKFKVFLFWCSTSR